MRRLCRPPLSIPSCSTSTRTSALTSPQQRRESRHSGTAALAPITEVNAYSVNTSARPKHVFDWSKRSQVPSMSANFRKVT
jgi:hypothetical protein